MKWLNKRLDKEMIDPCQTPKLRSIQFIALLVSTVITLCIESFAIIWPNDHSLNIHAQWVSYSVVLVYLLVVINQLDLYLRHYLTQSDTPIPLDHNGINILNDQADLSIDLVSDEHLEPRLHTFGDLPSHTIDDMQTLLGSPQLYSDCLLVPLRMVKASQVLVISDYVEARILPALPYLHDRPQLGLFAKRSIPRGKVLIWRSDYGLCKEGGDHDIPLAEKINRRPLAVSEGIEIFQSGGLLLRSNPMTLANFSWCHTESVNADQSPYYLLPPHDLGVPNSHFASVKITPIAKGQHNGSHGMLTSALITYRSINCGDQILAYSGEGYNAWIIMIRRLTSKFLELLTPALVLAPWIRLFMLLMR